MGESRRCPRCGGPLRPPGLMSSDWECAEHGAVVPFSTPYAPSTARLREIAGRSTVPVWIPWPLPAGWLHTGSAEAGTPRDGPQATVVACSGPNPVPNPAVPEERSADLLAVAERPGVGLGAHLAGLDDVDPGETVATGRPEAKIRTQGHLTALWRVAAPDDRVALVGEAGGVWLWLLLWPSSAGALLIADLDLWDVRDGGPALDPPIGAASPRLT